MALIVVDLLAQPRCSVPRQAAGRSVGLEADGMQIAGSALGLAVG
jgi:hypothetical protein